MLLLISKKNEVVNAWLINAKVNGIIKYCHIDIAMTQIAS